MGYTISTLSTPTLNRARQRRSYQSLSFAWRERAAMAEKLCHYEFFSQIASAMHASRLDCLLESALAAWDIELITPFEEQEAWWWVQAVGDERLRLGLRLSWEALWAELWAAVAAAMQLLLSVVPFCGPRPAPTRDRFLFRHKWALKQPTMADGTKVATGMSPEFSVWCATRDQLAKMEISIALRECSNHLGRALQALNRTIELELGNDPRDFLVTVRELREDIEQNMKACAQTEPLYWGSRRRWIPILNWT